MKYGETLSVANTTQALKVLRIEKMRRDMELAQTCLWTCKNGGKIPVNEMTDEHIDATISMLERIEELHGTYLENQGDLQ